MVKTRFSQQLSSYTKYAIIYLYYTILLVIILYSNYCCQMSLPTCNTIDVGTNGVNKVVV